VSPTARGGESPQVSWGVSDGARHGAYGVKAPRAFHPQFRAGVQSVGNGDSATIGDLLTATNRRVVLSGRRGVAQTGRAPRRLLKSRLAIERVRAREIRVQVPSSHPAVDSEF
jgi:hypothetical protein